MRGTSTVWFLAYHFTNHVGFQESGKLKYPEVPKKLNLHIFMTLPQWALSPSDHIGGRLDKYFNHCHAQGQDRTPIK